MLGPQWQRWSSGRAMPGASPRFRGTIRKRAFMGSFPIRWGAGDAATKCGQFARFREFDVAGPISALGMTRNDSLLPKVGESQGGNRPNFNSLSLCLSN